VLVGLPQGVGGQAILFHLFHFSLFLWHAPGARSAAPRAWWPCYFNLIYIILVNFHNMHHVLVGLPQGVGGLAILFYIS
jgi:hypothetical protein